MKKYSASFILILIFCFINSCKSEKEKIREQNELIQKTIDLFEKELLSQEIDSVFSKYNFNGIVAVYRDSVPVYIRTNGFSNFKNKTPIDTLTVFGIASNTKQFTAVMVLKLVEQGKIKLDDKVSAYLDDFKKQAYQNITIQQLLNHTSGFYSLGQPLTFESGSNFAYSNEGYNELGKLIEKISGKSYEDNASELFKSVGLRHTYTNKTFDNKDFGSAWVGKPDNPEEIPKMPDRLSEKGIGNPAGGILSTVEDLNRWNQLLFAGKILKPETLIKMTAQTAVRTNHFFSKVGYGDGLMMYGKGPLAYFHTGYVKGLPSVNIYYPATKTSVIVLSNFADESTDKKVIFAPHSDIRNISDGVQSTLIQLKKELLKNTEEQKE